MQDNHVNNASSDIAQIINALTQIDQYYKNSSISKEVKDIQEKLEKLQGKLIPIEVDVVSLNKEE